MFNYNGLILWSFKDAPELFSSLSRHGGDEDWVLYCPEQVAGDYWPSWLGEVISGYEDSYVNGFGHVDRHVLAGGDIVVIFAHA